MSGMGSHQSQRADTDSWITPKWILDALGPFDLDPCACDPQPWPTATRMVTKAENGLLMEWPADARVWLNPPYGRATGDWLARLAAHPGGGTALIFARTETDHWFRHVWPHARGVLFLRGRLYFHRPDGARADHNSGAPSALIAYGDRDLRRLRAFGADRGALVEPQPQP